MKAGEISWADLTVADAGTAAEFYRQVVGWESTPVQMTGEGGEYQDYCMTLPGEPERVVAGVCHARAINANLPPVWLVYLSVANLDQSLNKCTELGGSVKSGPRPYGATARYAVVQDPAGAYVALYSESGR